MPDMTRPRFNVQVVMPTFVITGQIEPVGPWLDFLNGHDKYEIVVQAARVFPIGSAAASVPEHSQVCLIRSNICLIVLLDSAAQQSVHMLKRTLTAISHIGPIVCRGEYHMGVDAQLSTYFDDLVGSFFPLTNVDLFPAVAMPASLPRKADMIIANRAHVQVCYLP